MTLARRLRWSEFKGGLSLETGQRHRLIIDRLPLKRLEVEDEYFHTASAVLLPDVPGPAPTGEAQTVEFSDDDFWKELAASHGDFADKVRGRPFDTPEDTDTAGRHPGLGLLIVALRFLRENQGHRLLVVGHADRSGNDAANLRLSAARARGVLAVLVGDRDAFVDACRQFHVGEDDSVVLRYMAEEHGWPCDPGTEQRPSRDAVEAFQSNYNERFSQSIAVDGAVGHETLGAYFDIYQDDLAAMAGGADELRALRENLRFVSSQTKVLPCGERYPIENPSRDGYRSQRNRRVELLFFEPHDIPDPADERTPDLIYKRRLFKFEVLDRGELPRPSPSAEAANDSVKLVDTTAPEPGVGDPEEPLQTQMVAVGESDAADLWSFLEPFDATQPLAGRQSSHVPPGPDDAGVLV
jgi:hypothetical protein